MLVNQENLKKGDEIMLAMGTKLVQVRLLREPTLRWTKDSITKVKVPKLKSWGLHKDEQLHCSMKCEMKTITTHFPARYAGGKPYTIVKIDNSLPDYNDEKYFDLNFRDIWLIEK